jgi:hypothetical protein
MRVFLDAYSRNGDVRRSCEIAGIAWKTHYRKLASDPNYQQRFALAQKQLDDLVDGEVFCRAIEEKSDSVLMFLARGRMPDKYRDRASIEHSGTINLAQILEAEQRVVRMKERDAGNPAA